VHAVVAADVAEPREVRRRERAGDLASGAQSSPSICSTPCVPYSSMHGERYFCIVKPVVTTA
jgi:hypothetical protein